MPFENRTWKFLVPVVGTLFLAAACSSSNDTTADDDDPPGDDTPVIALETFLATGSTPVTGNTDPTDDDAAEQNIARQTALAAAATPVGAGATGGVSQSSAAITAADDVDIGHVDGNRHFLLELASVSAEEYEINPFVVPGAGTNTNVVVTVGDENTASFTQIEGATTAAPGGTATLHVWLKTDKPGSVGDDADYLAYGFWIHDPVDNAATDLPTIGAFVDSNEGVVFPWASLAALDEEATYTGSAEGVYHEEIPGAGTDPVTSRFAAWTATASLTATFDSAAALGASDTISGTIDTFVGLPDGVSSPTVALAGAPLPTTETEGGFFFNAGGATASVMVDIAGTPTATDFAGDWGGKFYDDLEGTDAAANYPGTVAGTFGLADTATADTYRAFLGIFHADLDE